MLAVRTPIAGIFIAVLVLLGEVAGMRAYVAMHRPAKHTAHAMAPTAQNVPPPKFGRHRGCADQLIAQPIQ